MLLLQLSETHTSIFKKLPYVVQPLFVIVDKALQFGNLTILFKLSVFGKCGVESAYVCLNGFSLPQRLRRIEKEVFFVSPDLKRFAPDRICYLEVGDLLLYLYKYYEFKYAEDRDDRSAYEKTDPDFGLK